MAIVPKPAIFVVENDAPVRQGLRALLGSCGYAVSTFAQADECLAAMTETRPQLLVVTVDLPGMSGVEMLERLRGEGDNVPVIMLAAEGSVGMIVRAMRAGAVDCLEKPFFQSSLMRRVAEVLRQDPRPVAS
jgi:FixJ family two-component response regulator